MSHTCDELRKLAKNLGLRGYSTAKKARLIEMLEEHAKVVDEHKIGSSDAKAPEAVEKNEEHKDTKNVFVHEDVSPSKPAADKPAGRKPTLWAQFLSEWRAENGGSLKEAMSKKEEYAAYKAKHQAAKKE